MSRPKERIPIFLDLIDGNYTDVLTNAYGLVIDDHDADVYVDSMYDRADEIRTFWLDNTDLRFSQVLVNLGIIPNFPGFWYYIEDDEVLEKLGIELREYLLWGQNYDKDMNRLPKTVYKPIKDLNTGHIRAIINGNWCRSDTYIKCFEDELKRREDG